MLDSTMNRSADGRVHGIKIRRGIRVLARLVNLRNLWSALQA